jgi:hypothetical protein
MLALSIRIATQEVESDVLSAITAVESIVSKAETDFSVARLVDPLSTRTARRLQVMHRRARRLRGPPPPQIPLLLPISLETKSLDQSGRAAPLESTPPLPRLLFLL